MQIIPTAPSGYYVMDCDYPDEGELFIGPKGHVLEALQDMNSRQWIIIKTGG